MMSLGRHNAAKLRSCAGKACTANRLRKVVVVNRGGNGGEDGEFGGWDLIWGGLGGWMRKEGAGEARVRLTR
jgi:hypothetical protein